MEEVTRIGVIGDYRADFEPHPATDAALRHAGESLGVEISVEWIPTPDLAGGWDFSRYHAFFISPGSPYRSLAGALAGIRGARESGRPVIGTCAGFQHMVLEFARNVLGLEAAQSEEYDPHASEPVVTESTCSLAGQIMTVLLAPRSLPHVVYGRPKVEERYYCRFGLNPKYQWALHEAGLRVVGIDDFGEARVVALAGHPFYIGALYVPQVQSRPGAPHPLIRAFVERAASSQPGTGATPRQREVVV